MILRAKKGTAMHDILGDEILKAKAVKWFGRNEMFKATTKSCWMNLDDFEQITDSQEIKDKSNKK